MGRLCGASLEHCRRLGGCPAGEARITPAFRLPSRWIIHTVGPLWRGGGAGEALVLASCYRNSLTLAVEYGVRTIAFPHISTGVYGYPMELACRVALGEMRDFLSNDDTLEEVRWVCFSPEAFAVCTAVLAA